MKSEWSFTTDNICNVKYYVLNYNNVINVNSIINMSNVNSYYIDQYDCDRKNNNYYFYSYFDFEEDNLWWSFRADKSNNYEPFEIMGDKKKFESYLKLKIFI